MVCLLFEDAHWYLDSQLHAFKRLFDQSVVRELSSIDRFTVSELSKPPLLSDAWCIIYSGRCTTEEASKLAELAQNNLVVIHATSKSKVNETRKALKQLNISYNFIDNYNITDEQAVQWTMIQLGTDDETAAYIWKYCGYYLPRFVSSVVYLKNYLPVTKAVVRRYIERAPDVPVYEVTNFLLGLSDMSLQRIVSVVYQYRYTFGNLLETVRDSIQEYQEVFNLVADGTLGVHNISKVLQEKSSDNKVLGRLSEARVSVMLSQFDKISFDWVIYLFLRLSVLPSKQEGIIDFILLLKGVQ